MIEIALSAGATWTSHERMVGWARGAWLAAALACAFPGAAAADADANEQPWCAIDDPAQYRALRTAHFEAGGDSSQPIECSIPTAAEGRLPEELTLPMPCGRRMVFRRVDVPVSHLLDQVEGNFGRQVDPEQETMQIVVSSGAWRSPVAGSFTVAGDDSTGVTESVNAVSARAFYMAKYEISEAQALIWRMGLLAPGEATASNEDPACAGYRDALTQLDTRRVRAAGGFSWYDAVDFSRQYNAWLVEGDRRRLEVGEAPALPWEQGSTGAVRLPTEAEWEYAARGGASAVSSQARSIRYPRIVDPETGHVREPMLNEICAEVRDAQEASPVGIKLPNILGLHDMLCGVEEIVLDLFRATRPDGLHGQVGGFTTKGGASAYLREKAAVGMRVEKPLFRAAGETHIDSVGARFVVAAPVFVGRRDAGSDFTEGLANEPLNEALKTGRDTLLDPSVGKAQRDRADVERELVQLREQLDDEKLDRSQLQGRVAELSQRIDELNTRLGDAARGNTRQVIRAGVVSANLIDRIGRNIYFAMNRRRALQERGAGDEMTVEKWRGQIAVNRGRIEAAFDLYLQLHLDLMSENERFVLEQISIARRALDGPSLEVFGTYLSLFATHHEELRRARGAVTESMRTNWIYQLDTQKKARELEFPEFL